jgi:uncharacterized Zn finger protein
MNPMPCKKCDGDSTPIVWGGSHIKSFVECQNCGHFVETQYLKTAIKKWNAEMTRIQERATDD